MHIETLRVFCDLVESRSFSRAAVRNYVTQSAVSQQIKGLESRFERPLLTRTGRGVTPTDAGRIVYAASREILERLDKMRLEVRGLGEEMTGAVRVAAVYSVGVYELSRAIQRYLKTYPRVHLSLEFGPAMRIYDDCLEGSVDLGIVPYPKAGKGLEMIPLRADHLTLICSPQHPFASQRNIQIRKLDGENFVAFERGISSREAIDRILAEHGVGVNVVMEFDNIETIKRAVEIGAGVSIVPAPSVEREILTGTLAQLRFTRLDVTRPLGALVKRRRSLPPPVARFVDLLSKSD